MIVQPDGSIMYKRRGDPPEPPPGYTRSTDPYIHIPLPCVYYSKESRVPACCPVDFHVCSFYKEDINPTRCMTCENKKRVGT